MADTIQLENYLSIDSANEDGVLTIDDGNASKDVNIVKMAYYFAQGYDIIDISNVMGVSRSVVSDIIKSEKFEATMNSISLEVVNVARMFLASAGIKAVRTIIDCMDSPNDKVRLKAATEVLNRIGLTEPKKIEVIAEGSAFQSMSDEQMLELLKSGMEEIAAVGSPEYDYDDDDEGDVDDEQD